MQKLYETEKEAVESLKTKVENKSAGESDVVERVNEANSASGGRQLHTQSDAESDVVERVNTIGESEEEDL